jgi:hypothetical protein
VFLYCAETRCPQTGWMVPLLPTMIVSTSRKVIADLQMAGYAAALCVLTRYAIIDGRDMTAEAIRPRVKGETTFVDGLIAFAVDTANQCLVPSGIAKAHWDGLSGAERFYLRELIKHQRLG